MAQVQFSEKSGLNFHSTTTTSTTAPSKTPFGIEDILYINNNNNNNNNNSFNDKNFAKSVGKNENLDDINKKSER